MISSSHYMNYPHDNKYYNNYYRDRYYNNLVNKFEQKNITSSNTMPIR